MHFNKYSKMLQDRSIKSMYFLYRRLSVSIWILSNRDAFLQKQQETDCLIISVIFHFMGIEMCLVLLKRSTHTLLSEDLWCLKLLLHKTLIVPMWNDKVLAFFSLILCLLDLVMDWSWGFPYHMNKISKAKNIS